MTRAARSLVAGVCLMVLALGPAVPAQHARAQDPPPGKQAKQGPMKGMKEAMQRHMAEMAESKPMMLRHQMLMKMQVKPDDPAALLAVKDQLKLSDKQVKQLQKILEKARKQADKVLTEEQKKELAPLANTPDTSMKMHQQMMEKMQKMHQTMMGGKGKPGSGPAAQGAKATSQPPQCPMMKMMQMMQHQANKPAKPSGEKTQGKTK